MIEINARYFKKMLMAVSSLGIEKTRLNFKPEGLSIIDVDMANVCLVDVFIPKENFRQYETLEQPIAINVNELIEHLTGSKKFEDCSINFIHDQNIESHLLSCLRVQIHSMPDKITHEAFVPIVDQNTMRKQCKKPNVKGICESHYCSFNIKVKTLSGIMDSFNRYNTNAFRIKIDKIMERAILTVKEEIRSSNINPEISSNSAIDIVCGNLNIDIYIKITNVFSHLNVNNEFESLYSIDYFRDIMAGLSVCDNIHIEYGRDYPMYLTGHVNDNRDYIEYLLAPHIKNNY